MPFAHPFTASYVESALSVIPRLNPSTKYAPICFITRDGEWTSPASFTLVVSFATKDLPAAAIPPSKSLSPNPLIKPWSIFCPTSSKLFPGSSFASFALSCTVFGNALDASDNCCVSPVSLIPSIRFWSTSRPNCFSLLTNGPRSLDSALSICCNRLMAVVCVSDSLPAIALINSSGTSRPRPLNRLINSGCFSWTPLFTSVSRPITVLWTPAFWLARFVIKSDGSVIPKLLNKLSSCGCVACTPEEIFANSVVTLNWTSGDLLARTPINSSVICGAICPNKVFSSSADNCVCSIILENIPSIAVTEILSLVAIFWAKSSVIVIPRFWNSVLSPSIPVWMVWLFVATPVAAFW